MHNKRAEQLMAYILDQGVSVDQELLHYFRIHWDKILTSLNERIREHCLQNERIRVKSLEAAKQIAFFV